MRPQDSLCNAPIHLGGLQNKHGYYRDEHRCRGKGYNDLVEQSVEWSSLTALKCIEDVEENAMTQQQSPVRFSPVARQASARNLQDLCWPRDSVR